MEVIEIHMLSTNRLACTKTSDRQLSFEKRTLHDVLERRNLHDPSINYDSLPHAYRASRILV